MSRKRLVSLFLLAILAIGQDTSAPAATAKATKAAPVAAAGSIRASAIGASGVTALDATTPTQFAAPTMSTNSFGNGSSCTAQFVGATAGAGCPFFLPLATPPAFQAASLSGLNNIYGSCLAGAAMGGFGATTTQSLLSITGTGAGSNPAVPSCGATSPDCAVDTGIDYTCPESGYDDTAFQAILKQADDSYCCAQNEVSAIQADNAELSCIQAQSNQLKNQVDSLKGSVQQMMTEAQGNLSKIDSALSDRNNQVQFLQSKLGSAGGSDGTGGSGLLGLESQYQKMFTGDPATTIKGREGGLETAYANVQSFAASFQSQIKQSQMANTVQCFENTVGSGYSCGTGNIPADVSSAIQAAGLPAPGVCTPLVYLNEIYYQSLQSHNGQNTGQAGQSSTDALNRLTALDNILVNQYLNHVGSDPFAGAPGAGPQQASGPLSPQDLDNMYGNQLNSFTDSNALGLNVRQFVSQQFGNCFNSPQVQNQIGSETANAQSSLNVQLYDPQRGLKPQVNNFLSDNAQLYKEIWAAFGQDASLDISACVDTCPPPVAGSAQTSGCHSVSAQAQMTCARNVVSQLTALWNGTSQNSQVTVSVPATDPSLAFSFQCYGVQGCVTVMHNGVTNLNNEINRVEQTKKSYVAQANGQIDNFISKMAQTLSPQNALLEQAFSSLKASLASHGVELESDMLKRISVVILQKGDLNDPLPSPPGPGVLSGQGLYKMPDPGDNGSDGFLGVVAGRMSPPLIDPTSFDVLLQNSSVALKKDKKDEQTMGTLISALQHKADQCNAKGNKADIAALAQSVSDLNSACAAFEQFCEADAGSTALDNLANQLDSAGIKADTTMVSSALQTGIGDCADANSKGDQAVNNCKKAASYIASNTPDTPGTCSFDEHRCETDPSYSPPGSADCWKYDPKTNTEQAWAAAYDKAINSLSSSGSAGGGQYNTAKRNTCKSMVATANKKMSTVLSDYNSDSSSGNSQ